VTLTCIQKLAEASLSLVHDIRNKESSVRNTEMIFSWQMPYRVIL